VTYFRIYDDLRWYLRRGGENKKTISEAIDGWCRLMNPITPHLSEEIDEAYCKAGKNKMVSESRWPEHNEEESSLAANYGEELILNTMEGMRNVLKLAKLEKAKKFTLFVAEPWMYGLFLVISKEIKVTHNPAEIMKKVLAAEELKIRGKDVSKIVLNLIKDPAKIPSVISSAEEELAVIEEAKEFLEKEFECTVEVVPAERSEMQKAKQAIPGKIGILVE
jgi:leucyl-tRNA synthetase